MTGRDLINSVLDTAFEAGYRMIDTASVYRNESDIGAVLPKLLEKHSLQRSDIFVTSKLAPKDHGTGKCRDACLSSLERLGLKYLDLYLIHWPGVQGMKHDDPRMSQLRQESWRDLEQLYEEGESIECQECDSSEVMEKFTIDNNVLKSQELITDLK